MVVTQEHAAPVAQEETPELVRTRSFVTPSSRRVLLEGGATVPTEGIEDEEGIEELGTRTVIVGVVMLVIALLCFVISIGSIGSGSEDQGLEADSHELSALQKDISTTRTAIEALPATKDVDRGLVLALQAATRVAQLQNDYRSLTPAVAEAGGKLDPALTLSTRQQLTPYFTPSVDSTATNPWYLLADDAERPVGIGIPMSFDSGFEWVADVPTTIEVDGSVPVTWQAVSTTSAKGQEPLVLAWVRADYDITRQTFSQVRSGMTVQGESLAMEVSAG